LENMFHLFQQGLPVAVVDDQGKFEGVVEQSDVLSSMGRFSNAPDLEQQAAPHSVAL
jgi:glycine betaine/proline transport system ATP-binding protein